MRKIGEREGERGGRREVHTRGSRKHFTWRHRKGRWILMESEGMRWKEGEVEIEFNNQTNSVA